MAPAEETKWRNGRGEEVVTYTAKWCKPCRVVSPVATQWLTAAGFVVAESRPIEPEDLPSKIPSFFVGSASVQSSDWAKVQPFLSERLMA